MKSLHNILLYFYAFSLPFEYWDAIGLVGAFSVVKLVAILYFFISLSIKGSFSLKSSSYFIKPLFVLFGFMLFVNSIYVFVHPIDSELINKAFIQNIIIFWIFSNHLSKSQIVCYKALMAFTLGVILLGILFSFEIGIVIRQNRLSVFGDNPNNQGTKVALGIFLIFFFVLKDKLKLNKYRYLLLLAIPTLLSFLVATASRGALLTLFLSLFLLIILYRDRVQNPIYRIGFIAISVFISLYLYNNIMSNELIEKRMNAFVKEGSLGGRESIWRNTLEVYEKSPLIGVGEEGFKYEMRKLYNQEKSAHNYFLYILVTSGLVGLFIFIIFLFRILNASWFIYKSNNEFLYLLLFFIVVFAMLRSGGTLGDKSYWFFFSLIVGAKIGLFKNHYNGIRRV